MAGRKRKGRLDWSGTQKTLQAVRDGVSTLSNVLKGCGDETTFAMLESQLKKVVKTTVAALQTVSGNLDNPKKG